ncbi:hypothetical protein CAOG_01557 [Capsaspora owczarzaki ATCC 30864]|uniref:SCD domain-containing protein n=1 Tax=Capsaspora owczarzaki (strain ATCC 30864) TaxID=595528 RepID=A0A0D2U4Y1_CAPO3|nr:hypothetical protein CAOG_01557 [Capsaspora owczarzaki ATCC 30864]KJE90216.1 hypothetical protein CAOG_001557 [Capsaspora owczarzaki ATCC 30864]|eukprot:XP_004364425.2 hypothetical protein CAOG_01557 [Capsaspora owczarzaki ATCC 30864]
MPVSMQPRRSTRGSSPAPPSPADGSPSLSSASSGRSRAAPVAAAASGTPRASPRSRRAEHSDSESDDSPPTATSASKHRGAQQTATSAKKTTTTPVVAASKRGGARGAEQPDEQTPSFAGAAIESPARSSGRRSVTPTSALARSAPKRGGGSDSSPASSPATRTSSRGRSVKPTTSIAADSDGDDDNDNGNSDDSEAEASESSDDMDDSDDDAFASTAVKKSPRSAPRSSQKPSSTPASAAATPSGLRKSGSTRHGRAGKASTAPADEADDGSLYFIVKAGASALQAVADEWIERYRQDAHAALLELVNFVIRSSGCVHQLSALQGAGGEDDFVVSSLQELAERFDSNTGEYPLAASGTEFRRFKSGFPDFLHRIFSRCTGDLLHDQALIDVAITWLSALSTAHIRAFRHTATAACLEICSALVTAVKTVHAALDNSQRQLETERSKRGANSSSAAQLERRIENFNADIEKLEEYISQLLQGVFVLRYRDTCADIRALCVTQLGVWIMGYPSYFLRDTHTKYLGWTLNDQVAAPRLATLNVIHKLYENKDFVPQLDNFIERFRARIVDMCQDVDEHVAAAAIEVALLLLQTGAIGSEVELVARQVLAETKSNGRAAGKFVEHLVFHVQLQAEMQRLSAHPSDPRASLRPASLNLLLLIEFVKSLYASVGETARAGSPFARDQALDTTFLVEHLFGPAQGLLTDWAAMTELLLDDEDSSETDAAVSAASQRRAGKRRGKSATAPAGAAAGARSENSLLSGDDEAILVSLMVSAARRAVHQSSEGAALKTGKKMSAKEKDSVTQSVQQVTTHFAKVLPRLLARFGSQPAVVADLLSIVKLFDLELYGAQRMSSAIETLSRQISALVLRLADESAIDASVEALAYLSSDKLTFRSVIDNATKEIGETIVAALLATDPSTDSGALRNHVLRVRSFFQHFSTLPHEGLYEHLDAIAAACRSRSDPLPDDEVILCQASRALCVTLAWRARAIFDGQTSRADLGQFAMDRDALWKALLEMACDSIPIVALTGILQACWLIQLSAIPLEGNLSLALELSHDDLKLLADTIELNVLKSATVSALDDASDNEKELALLRRQVLGVFGNLIKSQCIDIKWLHRVLPYYLSSAPAIAEVIKMMLSRVKDMAVHEPVLQTITVEFGNILQNSASEITPEMLAPLRDLAHRLSLTFGVDSNQTKTRKAILNIHEAGIGFVQRSCFDSDRSLAEPQALLFFTVLREFSSRLTAQDAATTLGHLDDIFGEAVNQSEDDEAWIPYLEFRHNLQLKSGPAGASLDISQSTSTPRGRSQPSLSNTPTPRSSRGVKRRGDALGADAASDEEDEEDDRATPTPSRSRGAAKGTKHGGSASKARRQQRARDDYSDDDSDQDAEPMSEQDSQEVLDAPAPRSAQKRGASASARKKLRLEDEDDLEEFDD